MKLIIDIPERDYDLACKYPNALIATYAHYIKDGTPYEERPKGVWIVKQERAGAFVGDSSVYSYTCPFCKVKEFKKYPFCHCGADLRGASTQ